MKIFENYCHFRIQHEKLPHSAKFHSNPSIIEEIGTMINRTNAIEFLAQLCLGYFILREGKPAEFLSGTCCPRKLATSRIEGCYVAYVTAEIFHEDLRH